MDSELCVDRAVGHAVNAHLLRHADTDTEACRQLRAMATGVAAEMVQLPCGYFRVISMHNEDPLCPPPRSPLAPLIQHNAAGVSDWNTNSEGRQPDD